MIPVFWKPFEKKCRIVEDAGFKTDGPESRGVPVVSSTCSLPLSLLAGKLSSGALPHVLETTGAPLLSGPGIGFDRVLWVGEVVVDRGVCVIGLFDF